MKVKHKQLEVTLLDHDTAVAQCSSNVTDSNFPMFAINTNKGIHYGFLGEFRTVKEPPGGNGAAPFPNQTANGITTLLLAEMSKHDIYPLAGPNELYERVMDMLYLQRLSAKRRNSLTTTRQGSELFLGFNAVISRLLHLTSWDFPSYQTNGDISETLRMQNFERFIRTRRQHALGKEAHVGIELDDRMYLASISMLSTQTTPLAFILPWFLGRVTYRGLQWRFPFVVDRIKSIRVFHLTPGGLNEIAMFDSSYFEQLKSSKTQTTQATGREAVTE